MASDCQDSPRARPCGLGRDSAQAALSTGTRSHLVPVAHGPDSRQYSPLAVVKSLNSWQIFREQYPGILNYLGVFDQAVGIGVALDYILQQAQGFFFIRGAEF